MLFSGETIRLMSKPLSLSYHAMNNILLLIVLSKTVHEGAMYPLQFKLTPSLRAETLHVFVLEERQHCFCYSVSWKEQKKNSRSNRRNLNNSKPHSSKLAKAKLIFICIRKSSSLFA
jgi:hypothetical protein